MKIDKYWYIFSIDSSYHCQINNKGWTLLSLPLPSEKTQLINHITKYKHENSKCFHLRCQVLNM